MKILVVSPPTFGSHPGAAAKDTFANVELLTSMGHTVSFYAIGTDVQDPTLIKHFSSSHGVPVRIFMPELRNFASWLWWVVSKNIAYVDRAAYVFGQLVEDEEFKSYVAEFKPDAIMFFCSYGWPVAKFARKVGTPSIFRSHNYEASFFWESLNVFEKCYPSNWLRYIGKVLGERKAVFFSSITATLPFEEVYKYRRWKNDSIFIHTLAFPHVGLRHPWVHNNKKPLDIFYLGATYLVSFHLRGAEALVERIAPEVVRRAPGAFRFHICGSKLPERFVQKCDGINIIYENYVPDLEKFLDTMDIGAFPVWTGKVMKGKVFESLCGAFPVVIPHNCLGGYVLEDKKEILMAETADEFVEAILSLRDDRLREKLSNGAEAFAVRNFSKKIVSENLATILHAAVAGRPD